MRKRLLMPVLVIATLLAMVAAAYFVMGMGKQGSPRKAPKITLLAPPLPPPPPPPKFEKKPDPPKEQKQMKVEQPVPKPDSPPPSPELKMDGPAGSGPSAFAAGKITSEDLSRIGSGKPGGTGAGTDEQTGMFNPFTNFANLAKGELQRYLGKTAQLRRKRYRVELHLWITPTGALSRYEVVGSTGDAQTDEAIQEAMNAAPQFSQPLPANMPQPLRLRVTTGG
jgi:TonB family protein